MQPPYHDFFASDNYCLHWLRLYVVLFFHLIYKNIVKLVTSYFASKSKSFIWLNADVVVILQLLNSKFKANIGK